MPADNLNPADPVDAITLSGMSFHTLIGILPHERELPQPLEIDLTVLVTRGKGVVDYRDLHAAVRDAAAAGPIDYLEDLAETIARRVLENPRVVRAEIAVRKPHAAVGGPLRFAQVAIVRQQDA